MPLLQREKAVSFRFFGGFDGAERTVLGVFPPFIEPEDALFPLRVLKFSYRAQAALSHRDFLGTMLSCGIRREAVGDIVCGAGETIAVVSEEVAPFFAAADRKGRRRGRDGHDGGRRNADGGEKVSTDQCDGRLTAAR